MRNLILKFQVGCALGQVIEMGEILLEGYNFKFQSIPTDKISKKNEPQILKRKSNTEKNLTMNEK